MYNGEIVNGLPCGKGVLYYGDGHMYEGELKDGLRHGYGKYTTPTDVWEGEWANDKFIK